MKYPLLFCLLLLGQTFYSTAQQHTDIFPDMSGNELLTQLKIDYKPSFVLSYDQARDTLFGVVDRVGDSLECIYSGHRIYLPYNQDPTSSAYLNGSNDGINTEHTYPQSLWSGGNSPKSDMHHLYPTRAQVNNSRASDPFNDINDNFVDTWFYRNMALSSTPTSNIDQYSEDVNGFFEPRESVKGDIARSMFYFYTMYNNEANAVNTTFFQNQLPVLCEWNNNDPVDQKEYDRTWKIAEYQQGKPNPYVLDCTLISRTNYCSTVTTYCSIIAPVEELDLAKELTVSPNPTNGQIRIEISDQVVLDEMFEIKFYDVSGKLLAIETVKDERIIDIDIQNFPKGVLLVKIQGKQGIGTKKIIHY